MTEEVEEIDKIETKKKDKAKGKLYQLIKDNTVTASSVIDRKRILIPVSPALDDILGGGITSGSLVIVRGKYKAGKTTTCLHFAKKAQELGYRIVYLNIEARITKRDLLSIPGLDLSENKFEIIQSNDAGAPLTGEDFVAIGLLKLQEYDRVIVFFDSFSQLISQDNVEGDIRDRTRDSMPLTLSKFCKRVLPILNITDNICVGITHDVANTGPSRSTISETSGTKIQYANSFKISARWASPWIADVIKPDGKVDKETQIGQIIHWECENSALGPPNKTSEGRLRYGIGIDENAELFDLASSDGVKAISKSGSWYSFGDTKHQGESKFITYMIENPDFAAAILEETRARLAG